MDFYFKLFYSQFFVRIPYPTADFTGQTIIVTGSNTGLGLEAARHLARLGAAKIILAVRTVSKGETAAANIIQSIGLTKNIIEVWPLDLTSFDSVKIFAARANSLDRLDAVIQNAGILTTVYSEAEGVESHLTVNVISAVLLGLLILPKLRNSAKKYGGPARLAFVGSDVLYIAKSKEAEGPGSIFEAVSRKESADMGNRYPLSKLLLLYAVREIANRSPITPDSNVIINVLTPGACKSDIFRDEATWAMNLMKAFIENVIARTTEVGGRTLVHGATPDLGKEAHGAFLMNCKVTAPGPNAESEKGRKLQARFTTELFEKLEGISPGVTSVLN